jgi:uncharacterized protein (DUF4415 family)
MRITEERLKEIKAFKNTDFSDCPILTEEQMKEFKPSHLRKTVIKKPVHIQLDSDVADWLENGGEFRQTRVNTILRQEMLNAG